MTRRRGGRAVLALGALSLTLIAASQVTFTSSRGSDDAARRTVHAVAPRYVPWARPLRSNSPVAERVLFIVQGLLGAALLGVAMARLRQAADATLESPDA